MKNLYRFNEFLAEGKSIGDFTKDFLEKVNGTIKVAEEVAKKKEEEEKDPTFEFKDKPLEKGDSRKDWVKKIQDVFIHKKLQEKVDSKNYGSFGEKTETALKKYQKEKGKEETGKVNNELMKLILKDLEDIEKEKKKNDVSGLKDSPLKKEDTRKELVEKLQDALVKLGHQSDPGKNKGSFGSKTEEAVKKYQKEKKEKETGEVNEDLMKKILEDANKK
jgi:peptidoglycan hydrolase-like protein with peptidoglycan-binding domain